MTTTKDPAKSATYTYDDERVATLLGPGRVTSLVRYARGTIVDDPDHVQRLMDAGYSIVEGDQRGSGAPEVVQRGRGRR